MLTAKEAYALFLDLVMAPKDDMDAVKFVDSLLSKVNQDLEFIGGHAISRLIPDLPAEREGPIYQRKLVLLRP